MQSQSRRNLAGGALRIVLDDRASMSSGFHVYYSVHPNIHNHFSLERI
jgi:hypothetical protein